MHTRTLTLIALCWLTTASAVAQDAADSRELTVATYNVQNLFDVFDDPYTQDQSTRVKPRDELEQAAKLIRHLDADVLALQEVENEGVLKAFVNELVPELGYEYVACGRTNSGRGIRVGILSRVPIVSMTSYRFDDLTLPGEETAWRYARDLTHVRLRATRDRPLDLIVLHLKSKRDSPDDPSSAKWRLAEAAGVRRMVDEALRRDSGAWVLVAGDLNDTPDSAPVEHLTKELPADPGGAPAPGLVDLHNDVPAEQRITYLQEPYRSTIDYLLASPSLTARVKAGSAKVVGDVELLGGSDHAPVVATFDLSEKASPPAR